MQTAETLIASTNRLLALANDSRFDAQQRSMFRKAARWAAKEAVAPSNMVCVGQF